MRLWFALPLLAAAAACQQGPAEGSAGAASATSSAVAAPAATTSQAAVEPKPAVKAIVDAGGVTFDAPGGKTQELRFGSSLTQVTAIADGMFGAATERTDNIECSAGPMEFVRYGPLTLNFQDGKFVGWLARAGAQVVTSDGITAGKLMRDLKIARSVRMIDDSTLEGEFDYLAADGRTIGGFARGARRDALVDSLYAGTNCFFR